MGLAVAWGVVRSLPDLPDTDPTDVDYLGDVCLPPRVGLVIETLRYVDTHGLLICGLNRIGGGVSESVDDEQSTETHSRITFLSSCIRRC